MRESEVCGEIVKDCEVDANTLDGLPFNGRTVGVKIGEVLAMIQGLAIVCERVLKRLEVLEEQVAATKG
jgi:hypothetical protein